MILKLQQQHSNSQPSLHPLIFRVQVLLFRNSSLPLEIDALIRYIMTQHLSGWQTLHSLVQCQLPRQQLTLHTSKYPSPIRLLFPTVPLWNSLLQNMLTSYVPHEMWMRSFSCVLDIKSTIWVILYMFLCWCMNAWLHSVKKERLFKRETKYDNLIWREESSLNFKRWVHQIYLKISCIIVIQVFILVSCTIQ